MRINNNIQALNAYRNLSSNQMNTSRNLERLSSGMRINRAADDAAGLAISEKMRAQIRGLQMAERNSLDGISLIQTAEGALTEVHSMLHRMRELAVQAANDTNTETDRKEIQKEIDQLTSEINRIGNATEFNSKKLLNGGATKIAPEVDKAGVALATGEVMTKIETSSVKGGSFNAVETQASQKLVPAEHSLTISVPFTDGDTLTIDSFTPISFIDNGGDVDTAVETTPASQAEALKDIINSKTGSGEIGEKYKASIDPNDATKIILTQNAGFESANAATATITETNIVNSAQTVTNVAPDEHSFTVSSLFNNGDTLTIDSFPPITFIDNGGNVDTAANTSLADQANAVVSFINSNTAAGEIGEKYTATVDPLDNTKIVLKENNASTVAPVISKTSTSIVNSPMTVNEEVPFTAEQQGIFEFELTDGFVSQLEDGDTVTIGGQTFTAKNGGVISSGEFDISGNATAILSSLETAISGNSALSRFSTSVAGNKLTLTEAAGQATGTALTDSNIKAETVGEYTLEISQMFTPGEQIEIAGENLTFGNETGQVLVGNTLSEQASNIKAAIQANADLNGRFNVSVVDNKITLTEKTGQATGVDPQVGRVGNTEGTLYFNQIAEADGSTVKAKYEIDITNIFRENEVIFLGGETLKGVAGAASASAGEFSVDGNARDQANSLMQAISASSLSSTYNVSIAGSRITLEEKNFGDETAPLTKPETDLVAAIPGEFSFSIERATVGQSYTIDGIEIEVVNDSTKYNDAVNTGSAMRHSDVLSEQANNLRNAIERNPVLGAKYFVEGTGNDVVLKQRPGFESAVLPQIMLSNAGDGDVFKSNLQIGPNQSQIMTVELNDIRSPKLGISTTDPRTKIVDINGDVIEGAAFNVIKNVTNGLSDGAVEYSIDVTSHDKASAAIKLFDTAIERVNGERASLGALQNRLEHTINNLKVTHENLSSSESRIRDADMALEMTSFTKNNILNQSAQAMLAQANQLPQGVLQLLQG
ncbi:flagellin [Cytobacillus firmus]|uniref:flagellin N-terminal helical domain-containing protein n=1 Tax=Cytobacillus firmus TaxID=1399 RepID=UPI0036AA14E7